VNEPVGRIAFGGKCYEEIVQVSSRCTFPPLPRLSYCHTPLPQRISIKSKG
jgi:hypothetical protein